MGNSVFDTLVILCTCPIPHAQGLNRFQVSLPEPGDDTWGEGRVLVTTRYQRVVPYNNCWAEHYPIHPMTITDAVSLLHEVSGYEAEGADKVVNSHYVRNIPLDVVR